MWEYERLQSYGLMNVKQFIMPLKIRATGEKVKCFVEGCEEEVNWVTSSKKFKRVFLCFNHGEEMKKIKKLVDRQGVNKMEEEYNSKGVD